LLTPCASSPAAPLALAGGTLIIAVRGVVAVVLVLRRGPRDPPKRHHAVAHHGTHDRPLDGLVNRLAGVVVAYNLK
jgi:hypothetical protein